MIRLASCGALCALTLLLAAQPARAAEPCPRPAPGSVVPEPEELRSTAGVLQLDLSIRKHTAADGSTRYCYLTAGGAQSPTLRLHPGELLVLRLKNELAAAPAAAPAVGSAPQGDAVCRSGAMSATATNLHFHGLTVPPRCHQDEVLKTSHRARG